MSVERLKAVLRRRSGTSIEAHDSACALMLERLGFGLRLDEGADGERSRFLLMAMERPSRC
jgi:hypothetical protein